MRKKRAVGEAAHKRILSIGEREGGAAFRSGKPLRAVDRQREHLGYPEAWRVGWRNAYCAWRGLKVRFKTPKPSSFK